jgi:tetratricopeptide (TPR) repeat protein
VDAETGAHLWADRFDKPLSDLFDMQDKIVSRLANSLDFRLTEEEARRSERSLHPNSMDLYFQGKAWLYKGWTPEYSAQARGMFDQALALDPKNIEAMVWMAITDLIIGTSYLADDRAPRLASAEATLVKAVSLAPNHAMAHVSMGVTLMMTNRAAQGVAECERALALDHNLAEAHAQIGSAKLLLGCGGETEAHINEAFRLSPRDIFAFRWLLMVGFAKLQVNADTEALGWFLRSIEANRNYPITHFMLAATLALLGITGSSESRYKSLALDPSFTIRRLRDCAPSDNPTFLAKRERVYQGMRMAGVPEG